jgi:hypothetical protein
MNKVIFIFALLLTVVACKAAFATDDLQFKRIVTDSVMLATVKANADKYGLQCKAPTKVKEISIFSQSGDDVRYSYVVGCFTIPETPLEQPVRTLDINISGRDNGVESKVEIVEIHFLR